MRRFLDPFPLRPLSPDFDTFCDRGKTLEVKLAESLTLALSGSALPSPNAAWKGKVSPTEQGECIR